MQNKILIAALILGGAVLWHSQTGKYESIKIGETAFAVVDSRSGNLIKFCSMNYDTCYETKNGKPGRSFIGYKSLQAEDMVTQGQKSHY